MFYSNNHEPIHVHVIKGGSEARFQVQPEVVLLENNGLKPAELKLAESLVVAQRSRSSGTQCRKENQETIINNWNNYFKK